MFSDGTQFSTSLGQAAPLSEKVTASPLDANGVPVEADLHDPATWERFGWSPFGPAIDERHASERAFVKAALGRARAFHEALARPPETPCPVPVSIVGGDCLPTLTRVVVGEASAGQPPRFEPKTAVRRSPMTTPGRPPGHRSPGAPS